MKWNRTLGLMMALMLLGVGCDDGTGSGTNVDVKTGGDILDDEGQPAQNRLELMNPEEGEALTIVHNSDANIEVRYVTPDNTPIADATINFEIIQSTDDCEFTCLQPEALQGITDGDGVVSMKVSSKTKDADVLLRVSVSNNEAVQPVEALVKIRAKDSFDLIVKWNYDGIRSFEGVKPLLFPGTNACADLFEAPLRDKSQIGVPASRQNPDSARNADGSINDSVFTSLPNNTTYTVVGYAVTSAGLITVYGCNDERPTITDGRNTILEVDLNEVPILIAGTYPLTSNFDLTSAFPRASDPNPGFGDYEIGNWLDLIIDLFQDPGTTIWNVLLSIEAIADIVPDALKNLGPVVGQIINSAITEFAPDWIGNAFVIAEDISNMLTSLQLEGELVINDEPDEFGVLPEGQIHRYFAVTFEWNLPCETDPSQTCAPVTRQLKEVTGDPTLDVSGTWTGSVNADALTIDRHGLLIPIGKIALGIFETVALPAIFDDPRVNSLEKFVDAILITNLVESYNGNLSSGEQPVECGANFGNTICTCTDAGAALSGLILGSDGGFAGDVASTVGRYACEEGVSLLIGFIRNFFDGITVDSKDNLLLSTAAPCALNDFDGNLEYDAIGEPSARCDWTLDVTFGGGTNYVGTGLFFATRGGL